jgi:hypothetical protein
MASIGKAVLHWSSAVWIETLGRSRKKPDNSGWKKGLKKFAEVVS